MRQWTHMYLMILDEENPTERRRLERLPAEQRHAELDSVDLMARQVADEMMAQYAEDDDANERVMRREYVVEALKTHARNAPGGRRPENDPDYDPQQREMVDAFLEALAQPPGSIGPRVIEPSSTATSGRSHVWIDEYVAVLERMNPNELHRLRQLPEAQRDAVFDSVDERLVAFDQQLRRTGMAGDGMVDARRDQIIGHMEELASSLTDPMLVALFMEHAMGNHEQGNKISEAIRKINEAVQKWSGRQG